MVTDRKALRYTRPRHFIGFDKLFKELEGLTPEGVERATKNFPRYNLVKTGDSEYSLELALAGYARSSITIEILPSEVVVSSDGVDDDREFIHRGVTAKGFVRKFHLADNVEVVGGDLVDGMLIINLKHTVPEEQQPRILELECDKKQQQLLMEDV